MYVIARNANPSYNFYVGYSFWLLMVCRYQLGLDARKTCLRGFANNKGADQPAHPRSLISAYVFRFLKTIISKLATCKFSTFYVVSVAEQAGLNLALSETPKTGFLVTRPNKCLGC